MYISQKFIKISAEPLDRSLSEWNVAVLADRWIQRWRISAATGQEQYLFEDLEIFRKIRDSFHQRLWPGRDASEVEIRLLDMQLLANQRLVILAAAINASHTPQIYYALMTMNEHFTAGTSGGSYTLNSYVQLKHNTFYGGGGQSMVNGNQSVDPMRMRLMVNRNVAYVYDDNVVHQVYLNGIFLQL